MPSVRGELNCALNVSKGAQPDGRGSSAAKSGGLHECGPSTPKLHGKSVNVAQIDHILKIQTQKLASV